MASHQKRTPTIVNSIKFTLVLLLSVCLDIVDAFTSTKIYRNAAWPWRRIFAVIFLRANRRLRSNVARRDSQPTTGDAIRSACEKRGLKTTSHVVVHCDQWPSATLHEITSNPNASQQGLVFLYFHGGGYTNPLREAAHMPIVLEASQALHDGAGRTFLLEYGLTPELQYPGQLVQSACALNLLLTQLKCQLDQIVIGGDSAGANLALALLAHIKQPHPVVPKIIRSSEEDRMKGALLISPWVSNTFTAMSYDENATKDYLVRDSLEVFTQLWTPKEELWADILLAPGDLLKHLPVERVLLTVGGFEVFRDDVRTLATSMGARPDKYSPTAFLETAAEIHVQPGVDAALGLPMCKSLLEILLWCRSLA